MRRFKVRVAKTLVAYGASKRTIICVLKLIDTAIEFLERFVTLVVKGVVLFVFDLTKRLIINYV